MLLRTTFIPVELLKSSAQRPFEAMSIVLFKICMPAGPEEIVEVISKHPVKFGFEPIIMAGKLSLLKNDKSGMLYRISDAESVAVPAK